MDKPVMVAVVEVDAVWPNALHDVPPFDENSMV